MTPDQLQQDVARSIERLRRIIEATKLLNSTLDLSELTRIILQLVRDEVAIDRGTVFIIDRKRNQLRSFVAQEVESFEICLPVGSGIAGAVAESGEIIDIPDAYRDSRFNSEFDGVLGYRTDDIFCMPIQNREGAIVGVLELLNRVRPLQKEDIEFLTGISVHMGLALENAWLHRQVIEKKKIEQELLLAREIQENFYPEVPKVYGGVEISGSGEMCEAVGGDYLDFISLSDERFIVVVGDVSGKGIGSALLMTSLHATCRALLKHIHSLERVSASLNDMLLETTRGFQFVTLLIALVDTNLRKVHYISAGHPPPLRVDASGAVSFLSDGGGPPVGLFLGQTYTRGITHIDDGSTLVIYTDGVSEARNSHEMEFGVDRLIEVVRSGSHESASETYAAIRKALKDFTGEVPAYDDSTLIVLKF
jgi:sigma-B regulation protein RsbU (phosphoserine phosphatase)